MAIMDRPIKELTHDPYELRFLLRTLSDEELNKLKGQVDAEVMHRVSKVFGPTA